MIQINQLKLPINHEDEEIKAKILKTLRIKDEEFLQYKIIKRSIDARKKPDLFYVYSVEVSVKREGALKKRIRNQNILFREKKKPYKCRPTGEEPMCNRPVVIGSGPAGLFCAYQLAGMGYRPVLLERGADVDTRIQDVEEFWQGKPLKPNSNVQFGEGGAGTFSDGKLNTLVHDKEGRSNYVLKTFVKHGAPESILYDNKPHIGTDILSRVVKNMREQVISLGGEVHFHSFVQDFITDDTGNTLTGVQVLDLTTDTSFTINTDIAVLAIGHSSRDTFETLYNKKLVMEAKAFAVGVRMEHPQSMIDRDQYGQERGEVLPAAAYKLTAKSSDGRGVYTFCMCPGGYVVNASSEPEQIAVNGMSYHDRNGENANSAVIVTVTPEDYGDSHPLSGMEFQRKLEKLAYQEGRGCIPVQQFGDFCANRSSTGPGMVLPQMKGSYAWANLRNIFPEYAARALEEGIREFDRKMKGYAREDAVMSGVESRTSSPVKIPRDESFQSSIKGLYPCGEGAGYAGGITSAAMDGLKAAEAIAKTYRPFDKKDHV